MMTDPICSRRPEPLALRLDRAVHGFSAHDGTWTRVEGPHARVFDVPASRAFDRGLRLSLTLRCTAAPDVVQ
jgi:hypothetical protein